MICAFATQLNFTRGICYLKVHREGIWDRQLAIGIILIRAISSMSFLGKIGAIAAAAAAVGGLFYWAHSSYKKEQESIVEEPPRPVPQKEINIHEELAKLRQTVNLNDPSLDDFKAIFGLLTNYLKTKTVNLSNRTKENRRRRFPKGSRFDHFAEYFRVSFEGIAQLQQAVMQLQQEQTQILANLGLTQAKMAPFSPQLAPFMQEMLLNTPITLEQTKQHLQIKIDYLKVHGETLTKALIEMAATLSLEEKQFVPIFLNTVISDECFENQPVLDQEEIDIAMEKYKSSIEGQMVELEQVLMPLMTELQTALVGDQMGGMGGMGYPGDYDQGMGGMGGLGGYNEQAIQQQLEALRQQDPQAYEQLMAMMQAQMGR